MDFPTSSEWIFFLNKHRFYLANDPALGKWIFTAKRPFIEKKFSIIPYHYLKMILD